MQAQITAEREKRANILEAQGLREAAILRAEGDAQARMLVAEAEAKAITMVAEAAEKTFTDRARELKKLEVAQAVLANAGTKFIIPSGAELINVLGLDDGGAPQVVPYRRSPKTE